MVRNANTSSKTGLSRRKYVTLSTVAVAGVAGCMGGGNEQSEGLSTPQAATATFYEILYGDNNIDGANALYHPDSEAEPLEPANFEAFGGLEAIETEILSTEIISEDGGVTELHATVEYTAGDTTTEDVDHLFLRQSDDQWLVDRWVPEAVREQG